MSDARWEPPDRKRVGWWLFVLALAAVAAGVAYAFAGILVLGVFGYYATRPINDRIAAVIDSDDLAAWLTVLVVVLPLILLVAYAGFRLYHQALQALGGAGFPYEGVFRALSPEQQQALQSAFENPRRFVSKPGRILDALSRVRSLLGPFFGVQLVLALAVTLTYFLLANDDSLADAFRRLLGGPGTTAYAYAAAVDQDLESVAFGNFLFVLAMGLIAAVTYWATNVFAPAGLHVPMVLVLGFLTGVASLIPLVVGKVVYLPVVGWLAYQASQVQGTPYVFVGIVLVVYFFVLDFLPQTFVQPVITGRQLDTVMMMFGYLLGPILFGWYGLFLLPILFILMLEAVRIVLPDLIHGEALTPRAEIGDSVGTNPSEARRGDVASDGVESESDTDETG